MPEHSPTCAYLVRHLACDCDLADEGDEYPETPTDRAARLALDLDRAQRRIAELEAEVIRWQCIAERIDQSAEALAVNAKRSDARVTELEAAEGRVRDLTYAPDGGSLREHNGHNGRANGEGDCEGCWVDAILAALDGPPDDQQDRSD